MVGRRPKRQRHARRWLDEEQAAAAEQAAARAAAEFPEEPPPVLFAPPAATAQQMPLGRREAEGQLVAVWRVTSAATGAGSLFPARIQRWHPRLRQHSVRYAEEGHVKVQLEQETVEWREAGGVVTGPGAAWPDQEEEEEEEAGAEVAEAEEQQEQQEAAAAGEQTGLQQEQQQQEQKQKQQQEQQQRGEGAQDVARRPARSRRPSTRMHGYE